MKLIYLLPFVYQFPLRQKISKRARTIIVLALLLLLIYASFEGMLNSMPLLLGYYPMLYVLDDALQGLAIVATLGI